MATCSFLPCLRLLWPLSGIAIPMLPEKRVIGNQGIEFIEERQRGLTSFLRQVAGNPYLRHDHTFRMFLTVKDSGAGEWDQAKKVRSRTRCSVVRPAIVCPSVPPSVPCRSQCSRFALRENNKLSTHPPSTHPPPRRFAFMCAAGRRHWRGCPPVLERWPEPLVWRPSHVHRPC